MSASTMSLMDFLSVIFFIIAGVWLLSAILYSLMVLYFLRLRSLRQLHIIHDETFGRLYILPKFGRCCSRSGSQNHVAQHEPSNDTSTTTTTTTQPQSTTGRRRQQIEYYYISLGWIFRRHARHLNLDVGVERPDRDAQRPRYKRSERRAAIRRLLLQQQQPKTTKSFPFFINKNDESLPNDLSQIELGISTTNSTAASIPAINLTATAGGGDDDDEIPICSICLGPYEEYDKDFVVDDSDQPSISCTLPPSSLHSAMSSNAVFQSSTCMHVFHMECLLNWLQRPNNIACPCCRIPMLDETNIWNTILHLREKRKQRRERQELLSKEQKFVEQHENDGPIEDMTNSETEYDNV